MPKFLTDWRYWVALLLGCVALFLSEHDESFYGSFLNGMAIGIAYFVYPKE